MATDLLRKRQWLVLFCVNFTIPALLIWKFRFGEITEQNAIISAAVCAIGLNALVLYAFHRAVQRSGGRAAAKFIVIAMVLAVAGFSATAFTVSHIAHRDSYLDIALSNIPLDSIQPVRTRLVVELIRQTAVNSRENDKLLEDARRHPLDPQVYSPESFSSVDMMNRTVGRLTEIVAGDADYYAKQQSARQHFRKQMATVDPAYLESWDRSRAPQENAEAATEKLQREWLSSVKLLYSYASQHFNDLVVRDGAVHFSKPSTDAIFNEQMNQSKALHNQLLVAVQHGVEVQREAGEKVAMP